jgi:hypothetical protein
MEASQSVPGCVCLEQRGVRMLHSWGALHRHTRIPTLQGSAWTIIILGGNGSKAPDRHPGGNGQDETE